MTDTPLLLAQHVSKTWPNGQHLFTVPRLAVPVGKVTIITGANGAGKSTLLKILAGFIQPNLGATTTFAGTANTWPRPGRDVTLLHQLPYLLNTSVAGNVAYVLRRRATTSDSVMTILARVGLRQLADQPAHKLSSGEQRRLALARTLATAAPLVLLDEPTAHLDAAGMELARQQIDSMAQQGRAILMTLQAHDYDTAWAHCTRVELDILPDTA